MESNSYSKVKRLNSVAALIFMLLLLWSVCGQLNADVDFVSDHGFMVKNRVVINANRHTVWTIFVEQVDHWWPADHTWWGKDSKLSIEPYAGGCFCEKDGNRTAEHMRISFVEPEKLLRMTGGLGPLQGMGMFGALDWSFKTDESGTEVTMSYSVTGINPGGFKQWATIVDKVQALQLSALAAYVTSSR